MESVSDIAADSTSYTHPAPASGFDRGQDTDLTLKWRKRLRAFADPDPASERDTGAAVRPDRVTDPAVRSAPSAECSIHVSEPFTSGFAPGFTPGKAGPISSDPRHNRVYPHPKNPGLFTEADGFYDWAGRRLFLPDGAPDPMTPGAYRYQTRPDLCDLDAPDSNPSSPRYEPDHLRHKPGDTWVIDRDRPYDVLDPGPFGSPGWFPDRRTGRHRRDELPDPIPWWEVEEEPEKAEWAEHAEALWERRTRITREREAREAAGQEATDLDNSDRDDTDPPEPPNRHSAPEERPSRQPRPQPRSRTEAESEARQPFHDRSSRVPHPSGTSQQTRLPRQADRRSTRSPEEQPHRFDKLREDAWDRFIEKSAGLAAAHHSQTALERECGPTIGRIARGVRLIAGLLRTRTRPREPKPVPPARHTALADRTARFAQAMRGAQRARAEASPPQATRHHLSGGAAWA